MRLATLWLLPAALALLAGCDSGDRQKTAVVKGKVTYRSKPVAGGTVTFVPDAGGPPATGEIKPDGTFTLTTYKSGDGAVLGKHKVFIAAMEDMSDKLPEQRSPTPAATIPLKYTSLATTPLTAEVGDKENAVEFVLKD
jgi:hypothetical protein